MGVKDEGDIENSSASPMLSFFSWINASADWYDWKYDRKYY